MQPTDVPLRLARRIAWSPARPSRRLALCALAAMALGGCAPALRGQGSGADPAPPGLPQGLASARFALLGEVHDNPAGHALRLAWLREMTRSRRWAIAMEQFDTPDQARLDEARARLDAGRPNDIRQAARELAESAGFSFRGWDWDLYEPVIVLALERGLPLVAANLPIRRTGAAGDAQVPSGWGAAEAGAMAAAIRDGHCGLLPERAVGAMVSAQIARDATMARAMVSAHRDTGLPVVLLAGNGHVRTDIGVPRHLSDLAPGAAWLAVGIGERGAPAEGRYDRRFEVEPARREDPCETLRRNFGGGSGSGADSGSGAGGGAGGDAVRP